MAGGRQTGVPESVEPPSGGPAASRRGPVPVDTTTKVVGADRNGGVSMTATALGPCPAIRMVGVVVVQNRGTMASGVAAAIGAGVGIGLVVMSSAAKVREAAIRPDRLGERGFGGGRRRAGLRRMRLGTNG